ncbi:MAG: DUF433 domain-containing protein [Acidobacteria bacterium]|nr:DUF433 domain-containing protein [Acidobacteriota bacterium]
MHSEYVEQREGHYYVATTRVSLDSVVYAFNRGESPERILENFPLIEMLSRIYGAIAFYLDHKAEIDQYLEISSRELEAQRVPLEIDNPALWQRIQRAKARIAENSA